MSLSFDTCFHLDVIEDLQPLCYEVLGEEDIEIQFEGNPINTYPNFFNGESKWCVIEDIGPNTSSLYDKWTNVEEVKKTGIFLDRWNRRSIDPIVLLCLLCNLGKIPEGTYVLVRWW